MTACANNAMATTFLFIGIDRPSGMVDNLLHVQVKLQDNEHSKTVKYIYTRFFPPLHTYSHLYCVNNFKARKLYMITVW